MKLTNLNHPVMSSWLPIKGSRLDSKPYLSGAMEARMLLEKLRVERLPLYQVTKGGMDGIFNGPRFSRTYVDDPKYGVPFLGSTDILVADLSTLPLLSKRTVEYYPELLLQEGWTLITCSGTIGRMAYARSDMAGMAGSQHFMRVVPNSDKILPGYLYAYQSSRFGVPQVVEGTYGAIIQHIEPYHIADMRVPIAPMDVQEAVHKRILEMARLRTEAVKEYHQATTYVFKYLGLVDPSRHAWLSDTRRKAFTVTHFSTKSLRALTYDPAYTELCSSLEKIAHSKLGELCDPEHFGSGIIFKRIDADPEFSVRLVGQREAFQYRPEGRWISRKSIEGLGLIVPKGTTLIAAHGTLGETEVYCRSIYVTDRTASYAFSGDFVRCLPLEKKILPGYLFAFLRSEAAFRILRCISTGAKQQAPHPELLWNIPVPRLSLEQERQIHILVESGAKKQDRSLELEEEAWGQIEKWIMEETR